MAVTPQQKNHKYGPGGGGSARVTPGPRRPVDFFRIGNSGGAARRDGLWNKFSVLIIML